MKQPAGSENSRGPKEALRADPDAERPPVPSLYPGLRLAAPDKLIPMSSLCV
jgi:hypothetical protein